MESGRLANTRDHCVRPGCFLSGLIRSGEHLVDVQNFDTSDSILTSRLVCQCRKLVKQEWRP